MSSHAIYMCRECGHIYDQARGEPEAGIEPGTDIDAFHKYWCCPECDKDKGYLEQVI